MHRVIRIVRMADSPLYFVPLFTKCVVEAVAAARSKDWAIAGATCTHYLPLTRSFHDAPGFDPAKVVLTPPLRTE